MYHPAAPDRRRRGAPPPASRRWRVFWYIKDEESNMLNSIFPTKRTYGTTPFHFLAPSKTKNETES
jgi:hypothetical protein